MWVPMKDNGGGPAKRDARQLASERTGVNAKLVPRTNNGNTN